MKKAVPIRITTIGLAIFSMLFGAGNIIYPIKAGVIAGSKNFFGIMGFLLTGVILPILGLISMILFEGNYKKYFNRLGKTPGFIAVLFCMLIIGPLIAMPRCITVPFDMLAPFMPQVGLPIFSILFCLITFLLTYRESKILDILGNVISPILVGSLGIIIAKGLWNAETMVEQTMPTLTVFTDQVLHGFLTLDLLGALFFAYIVIRILKSNKKDHELNTKHLALVSLKGGLIAAVLLAAVYVGFSYLGAFYGHTVNIDMNGAEMFNRIATAVIHKWGVLVIITAVLMACFSTITALAAVLSEYLHHDIFRKQISYVNCLLLTLGITCYISNFGLSNILKYSTPFINVGYPIIIMIMFCNLAYSLFDFKPIKIPVALMTILMTGMSLYSYLG